MKASTSTLLALFLASSALSQLPPVNPGFPNLPQTPGAILSGLNAPQQGRTAIIAYHNGILFTVPEVPSSQPGADFIVRSWDLADPTQPVVIDTLGHTPMPINAHGYLKSGDYLVLGPNWPPEAPWSFRADGPLSVARTAYPDLLCAGARGCLFQPWFIGPTFWSYNEVSGNASLSRNWQEMANWDHLGQTGVIGHPFILGDLLIFASDQSRTGVATYDIGDPTQPVLLDVLTTGGPGGYFPELWGGDGKLYAVFPYRTNGNGFRVVDLTDPSNLSFVTDKPLPGADAMYIQFQDEYAFMGGHKVDMRSFESVLFLDGANVTRPSDGGTGIDTSQFLLPLGNLLVTGGIGPDEGMAIWAHQAAPDTRGPAVGYHIPQAGRSQYPLEAPISLLIHETLETPTVVNGLSFIVRPLGGTAIAGRLTFSFDDVLTFTPDAPLQPNTTYEVVLPGGGIKDAAGNGIAGYSFTFSTGASVGGNAPPNVSGLTASLYPVAPGQSVTLSALAVDPDVEPLDYRFDFGDGTPKTAWSTAASAAHSYGAPGHYRATVQVRDPSGSLATRTLTVTVLAQPAGPRPRRSSTVLCDSAARRIWTVNPDNDTVTAVDADGLGKELEVPACADPRSLDQSADGELWIACHDDDRVVVLDGTSGSLVASIPTGYGSAPIGVALSPGGNTAYVTLQGAGELRRYDAGTRQLSGALPLGPTPRALAVSGDGSRIFVTRFLSPRHHAEVWEVEASSFTLSRTLRIPKFGNTVNRDSTASGRGVANYLTAVTLSPDGASAWVASTKTNSERGTLFGPDLDQDNTVRNVVSKLDLATGTLATAVDLDNSDSATAIAFSPLGDYLYVTLQGNNELIVLDALVVDQANGLGSLVTRLATGRAPQGVCADPTTNRTFVKNFLSRDLSVLETDPLLRVGDVAVSSSATSTVADETLSPTVLLGKQIFYDAGDPRMSAEGYLSCATCHTDGGQDGRVWDFTGRGEGLRNTVTLRGRAGTGHGNVHWSANFDEIQDFENDIRGAFGGSGFLSNAHFAATASPLGPPKAGLSNDLDALAAYVASLGRESLPRSPFRNSDGSMTSQGLAGRALFASLGCGSCHSGPSFTDSTSGGATLHPVGTVRTTSGQRLSGPLTGIDTPTLLGVWATAPYLHDGSAADLEAVFRTAGGTVLPAEDGTPGAGTQIVDQWVHLNNDDTVHDRAFASLRSPGASLTLSNLDGGSGGLGGLELRYSVGGGLYSMSIEVNGVATTVQLPAVGNSPSWRHTNWEPFLLEGVSFNPGPTNTLVLSTTAMYPDISLDDVLVSTADDLAAAAPHRAFFSLSSGDRAALLAYLRQLDGQPEGDPAAIFADGFEGGNTTSWSSALP